jgi:nucleoside-diphosphate-sugar epimerase
MTVATICILGGLGYIGRHVSLAFLAQSHAHDIVIVGPAAATVATVSILDALRQKFPARKVFLEWCDLTDTAGLTTVFNTYHVTTVIYTLRNSFLSHMDAFMDNYKVTAVLSSLTSAIAAAPPITKFIMVSNTDIYAGNGAPLNKNGQYDKKDGFNVQHPYAFLVYLKEKMAHDFYNMCKRLALVILRVAVPVGSDDLFFSTYNYPATLPPSFQHNLLAHYAADQKQLLPIYKSTTSTIDGAVSVNFISVKDVATAVCGAYDFLQQQPRTFKIYNVANPVSLTAIQWLRALIRTHDDLPSPRFQLVAHPHPHKHSPVKLYNTDDTHSDLNWTPQHKPHMELANLVAWILK